MADLCLRCNFHEVANEALAQGDDVYADHSHSHGVHVFVFPKGVKPDIRLRHDDCFSSQHKAWYCEIPEKCTCGKRIKLLRELTWKPDANAKPEPVVYDGPIEPREYISLL